MIHTLHHALNPEASECTCAMAQITNCVICEKRLSKERDQVDTCPGRCYQELLRQQRT